MLVLSRNAEQEIHIGGEITIKVLSIDGGRVRLGITAPKDVDIERDDLKCRERKHSLTSLQGSSCRTGGSES